MAALRDLGPMTLYTVLTAWANPDKVPSNLRLYSDNRPIKEYQKVFESVSGEKLKTEYIDFDKANSDYEAMKDSIPQGRLGRSF